MIQNKNTDFTIGAGIFVAGLATPYIFSLVKKLVRRMTSQKQPLLIKSYGAVEMGGTNYSLATANVTIDSNGQVRQMNIKRRHKDRVNDENCDITMDQIGQFFGKQQHYDFIGIASFGPICMDTQSPQFGYITSTPKLNWQNYPILKKIQQRTHATNYGFDTDVNAPALAELKLGNHKVSQSLVYVTVGTGVGVGVVANGNTIHGLMHPEGGHIIVERHPEEWQNYKSVCPYHTNCLQGYVTNNAIARRYGIEKTQVEKIGDEEKVWMLIGYYLAQLCYNITLLISPQVIILGGGIMKSKIIFDYIYEFFPKMLNQYVQHPKLQKKNIAEYIRAPTVEDLALKGAMMLSPIK